MLDDAAFGAATEVTPKFISPADPAARWTGAHGGPAFFAYSTNYLIDLEQCDHRRCRGDDGDPAGRGLAAKRMIERSMERFDLYPAGSAATPAMARPRCSAGWSMSTASSRTSPSSTSRHAQDGTFSRDDFSYDHDARRLRLPAGKMLTTTGTLVNDGATCSIARAATIAEPARFKPRCCPKQPARKVPRTIHEGARDMAREIAKIGRAGRRGGERKKVEMLFAHLKRILKLDRLRLRGPNGARDEFLLAATAQNLRKLAKLIPAPNLKPA